MVFVDCGQIQLPPLQNGVQVNFLENFLLDLFEVKLQIFLEFLFLFLTNLTPHVSWQETYFRTQIVVGKFHAFQLYVLSALEVQIQQLVFVALSCS